MRVPGFVLDYSKPRWIPFWENQPPLKSTLGLSRNGARMGENPPPSPSPPPVPLPPPPAPPPPRLLARSAPGAALSRRNAPEIDDNKGFGWVLRWVLGILGGGFAGIWGKS